MATTVTHYGSWSGPYSVFRLWETIDRTAVSVPNNTSTVRARVWVQATGSGSFVYISQHVQYIDGYKVVDASINRSVAAPNSTLILDNSRTVSHNAVGDRSVYAEATLANAFVGSLWCGGSLVLDRIPRATTPTVEGNKFTTGVATKILLPRATNAFTHSITYSIGTLTNVSIVTNAAEEYVWTPNHDLAKQFINNETATITITVTTMSGSTVIGTKVIYVMIVAGASLIPTISAVTWYDNNATIRDLTGTYVSGLSQLSGTVTAAGVQNSTVPNDGVHRRVIIDGQSYPQGAHVVPIGSGPVVASGAATDSRGRTATKAADFTVVPYTKASLGSGGMTVSRANASNVADDLGTHLRLDIHATATSLKKGTTEKNVLRVLIETKKTSQTDFFYVAHPVLVYTNRSVNAGIAIPGSAYSISDGWDVRVTLTDNIPTSEPAVYVKSVSTGIVALHLSGSNVGVGKLHQQGALDVNGDVYSSGKRLLSIDEALPAGSIVNWSSDVIPDNWLLCNGAAVSRTTYSDLFAIIGVTYGSGNGSTTFTLPDLRGRATVGKSTDTEFNTLGKKFGTKTHTLTTAEMPSHTHTQNTHTHGQTIGWGAGSTGGGYGRTDSNNAANMYANVGMTAAVNQNTGGGGAHNNIQPSIALHYIIRAIGGIGALSNTVESVLLGRVAAVETALSSKIPAFTSTMTAAQSWSGTTTDKKVLFNSVLMDTGGHYNSSTNRFVAPTDGLYEFDGHLTFSSVSGGPAMEFRVNGAQKYGANNKFLGYNNSYDGTHWTEMVELSTGDYVEVWMSNPNNTAISIAPLHGTRFSGRRLQEYPV